MPDALTQSEDLLAQRALDELLSERLTPSEYEVTTRPGRFWISSPEERGDSPALHAHNCTHTGERTEAEGSISSMFRRFGGTDLYPATCAPEGKACYDAWCRYAEGRLSCEDVVPRMEALLAARRALRLGELPHNARATLSVLRREAVVHTPSYQEVHDEVALLLRALVGGVDAAAIAALATQRWDAPEVRAAFAVRGTRSASRADTPVVAFFAAHALLATLLELWSPSVFLGERVGLVILTLRELDAIGSVISSEQSLFLRGMQTLPPAPGPRPWEEDATAIAVALDQLETEALTGRTSDPADEDVLRAALESASCALTEV